MDDQNAVAGRVAAAAPVARVSAPLHPAANGDKNEAVLTASAEKWTYLSHEEARTMEEDENRGTGHHGPTLTQSTTSSGRLPASSADGMNSTEGISEDTPFNEHEVGSNSGLNSLIASLLRPPVVQASGDQQNLARDDSDQASLATDEKLKQEHLKQLELRSIDLSRQIIELSRRLATQEREQSSGYCSPNDNTSPMISVMQSGNSGQAAEPLGEQLKHSNEKKRSSSDLNASPLRSVRKRRALQPDDVRESGSSQSSVSSLSRSSTNASSSPSRGSQDGCNPSGKLDEWSSN